MSDSGSRCSKWHCTPFILTSFTDFSYLWSPNFYKSNYNPLFAKLELKFLDCLEAYGLRKGSEKCADLLYDLAECNHGKFQNLRARAIHDERMKQYRAGKLAKPFEEHPPLDSYLFM